MNTLGKKKDHPGSLTGHATIELYTLEAGEHIETYISLLYILTFLVSSTQADNEDMIEMVMDDWLKKVDLNRDQFVTMDEFLGMCS
jgi:hypothetical protein